MTYKTFDEALDEAIVTKLNETEQLDEAVLPGKFDGSYIVKGGKVYQAKITNNRGFYYSRLQASWMPIKKSEIKTTDKSWEEIKKEVE